eukprot:scaffold1223_cov119-Cylindrotheca_fusiformis.AAC.3
MGCLNDDDEMMQHVVSANNNDNNNNIEEPTKRGFPVILVYHTVVTLALFFMQYQARKMDGNLRMMFKLKEELTEARKGK